MSARSNVCAVGAGPNLVCWGHYSENYFSDAPGDMETPTSYDRFADTIAQADLSSNKICGILDGLYVQCAGDRYLRDGTQAAS